jgi:hypothetical protein
VLAGVPESDREQAWAEIEQELQQFEGPDGFIGPMRAARRRRDEIVAARRPRAGPPIVLCTPKEIKRHARPKPPEPTASHAGIDDWLRRQVPHLQPILQALDESIRATIPGLHYAVKWKRPYYGLPELGWLIELAAYDVSVNVVFLGGADFDSAPPLGTGARARYVKGDDSGGGTTTGAARVGRGGEPHAGLESGAERWLRPQLSRSGSGEGVDVGRVVVCR